MNKTECELEKLFTETSVRKFISMVAILFTGVISVLGCVSNFTNTNDAGQAGVGSATKTIWEEADSFSAIGEYYQAWYMITRTPSGMESKTIKYLKNNKRVYDAGKNIFNVSNLRNQKANGYGNKYIYEELGKFERFATSPDLIEAKNNVNKIYGKRETNLLLSHSSSQPNYTHHNPEANRLTPAQARVQCDYEVEIAVPKDISPLKYTTFLAMGVEGYTRELIRDGRKKELYELCMKAKGF
jgi:hypothetical protein